VRAPWCSSGPPSYSSSSSHLLIRTEALHPTLLHRLPPCVACKAARNCLRSASRIAITSDTHPYFSSLFLTIFIYILFFQSLCFFISCLYLFGFFVLCFFYPNLSPIYLSYSLFLMTPRLPYGGFYFVFLILEI